MNTTAAFVDLCCTDCGTVHDPSTSGACTECGGALACRFDRDAIDLSQESLATQRFEGIERYAPALPFSAETLVTLSEGATPLVPASGLAADLGVGEVLVKDEGRNPTGTVRDRAFALAVTAAREAGADGVALPTTGDGGQSAAAYAARADLDSEAFVPTRSTFVAKAMTNVHGGEMSVVEGRYLDAVEAFRSALDGSSEGTRPLAPGDPYRHEGLKTLVYEVAEQRDWTLPDALIVPTAHGESAIGALRAVEELGDLGLTGDVPSIHVAQPAACSPVVEAWDAGADRPDAWERPDTLVGALEVPDPALGRQALDAVRETGGRCIAVDDDDALEAAVGLASEGIEASATGGVGAAAARRLAGEGHLREGDAAVVVNPVAGNKENDVLRSHLMRKGV